MNLKIGGSNVGKIMYNGQEFGGATKLEPGTIFYMSKTPEKGFKDVHLLSTTKNWNNLNGINISIYVDFSNKYFGVYIPSDDFKNLYIKKTFKIDGEMNFPDTITISTSTVDGEYRLSINTDSNYEFIVKAI